MEGTMSYQSWQEFVGKQRSRYRQANRSTKGRILTEGCDIFGVHRKSLIRAFSKSPGLRGKIRGRKKIYGPELLKPLKHIWLACEQPCSKRLHEALPLWLPSYEKHHGALETKARQALLNMSPSTMDRLLKPLRAKRRKGLCATRPSQLQGQIPIRTRFQEVDGPGWLEADTVAHCGQSLAGAFVWSVTVTDIWSGWTESRAIWNRSSTQLVKRMEEIEEVLPFDMLGFDSDNGSEFLNYQLLRYLQNRPGPVEFTRSRPYRKNDNAHVEQKQWTHVRQLLGYDRFENRKLIGLINSLYAETWRLKVNFFLPSMRLVSKTREKGHISRHHSKAQTPCQRLLESPRVDEKTKYLLRKTFEELDPFDLSKKADQQLKVIFALARRKTKSKRKVA